ncbi:MAG TPA: transglycosylase SLT domain-containing protein [Dissulfurispiraceae bacterium]|nr:transglycosylase SLT domain-containing protein [Dissulfurispiraceae bacterium]
MQLIPSILLSLCLGLSQSDQPAYTWAVDHGATNAMVSAAIAAQDRTSVEASTLLALAYCESSYKPNARGDGGRSKGLMQIQSCWYDELSEELGEVFNPDDPEQAIFGAAYILLWLGWQPDEDSQLKALARYNGSRRINRHARKVWRIRGEIINEQAGDTGR